MDRNQVFKKYSHDFQEKVEIPMHSHTNGQINYVRVSSFFHFVLVPNCFPLDPLASRRV